jgi:hypothetical protein
MPRKKKSDQSENKKITTTISPQFTDEENVVKFIDKVIKQNIKIEKQKEKERLSDFNNLVAINSEWLDSFIILGYNIDGDEVVISKSYTDKDYNSLMLLLKKVFINLFMKNE